jgi:hypothetical protein
MPVSMMSISMPMVPSCNSCHHTRLFLNYNDGKREVLRILHAV